MQHPLVRDLVAVARDAVSIVAVAARARDAAKAIARDAAVVTAKDNACLLPPETEL